MIWFPGGFKGSHPLPYVDQQFDTILVVLTSLSSGCRSIFLEFSPQQCMRNIYFVTTVTAETHLFLCGNKESYEIIQSYAALKVNGNVLRLAGDT
jgi:hypothetical protein